MVAAVLVARDIPRVGRDEVGIAEGCIGAFAALVWPLLAVGLLIARIARKFDEASILP